MFNNHLASLFLKNKFMSMIFIHKFFLSRILTMLRKEKTNHLKKNEENNF